MEVHGSGRPVLVGVDGSDASYKAVWWAANYAAHSHLGLAIVVVYSLPSYAAVSFDTGYTQMVDGDAAWTGSQSVLAKAKGIALEQGLAEEDVDTLVVTGDPSATLVELSRDYDLIVIGSRGKGGLAERLLNTTSSSLPAYAYCPVVVVPYTDDQGNMVHLDSSIRRVVVASDDSRWGARAIDVAGDLAAGWSAALTVVTALPTPNSSVKKTELEIRETLSPTDTAQDEIIRRMREVHPELEVQAKTAHETASKALLSEAADADVIVVGSRGRAGLTGLLLGSKSQDLIQHSSKPVYVVPKKFVDTAEWKSSAKADVTVKPTDAGNVIVSNEFSEALAVETAVEPAAGETVDAIEEKIDPAR